MNIEQLREPIAPPVARRSSTPVPAPTAEQLQVLLTRVIKRLMKVLTRKGFLIEERGMTLPYRHRSDLALGPFLGPRL